MAPSTLPFLAVRQTSNNSSPNSSSSNSQWWYYAAAGGGAALLIALVLTIWCCRKHRRKNYTPALPSHTEAWKLEDHLPAHPRPNSGSTSHKPPPKPTKPTYGGSAGHDASMEQEQGLLSHAVGPGHSHRPNAGHSPRPSFQSSNSFAPQYPPPASLNNPPIRPEYDGRLYEHPTPGQPHPHIGPSANRPPSGIPPPLHPQSHFSPPLGPMVNPPHPIPTLSPPPQHSGSPPPTSLSQGPPLRPAQAPQGPPGPPSLPHPHSSPDHHSPPAPPGPASLSAQLNSNPRPGQLPLYLQNVHGVGGEADSYFAPGYIGTIRRSGPPGGSAGEARSGLVQEREIREDEEQFA